ASLPRARISPSRSQLFFDSLGTCYDYAWISARVAKLADAPDLGSGGEILRGSSPLPGSSTNNQPGCYSREQIANARRGFTTRLSSSRSEWHVVASAGKRTDCQSANLRAADGYRLPIYLASFPLLPSLYGREVGRSFSRDNVAVPSYAPSPS